MDKPPQPPEGKLIADRLAAQGVSIRDAAKESGYSEGRIRQVINGYASAGKGQYIEVIAPDEALAKIAFALDLSVMDLRRVGRPEAGEALLKLSEKWLADQRRPAGYIERVDVDAIKRWAIDPLLGDPPDGVLELFTDEVLLSEITDRMNRYRQDVGDYIDLIARLNQEVIENDKAKGGNGDGSTLDEKRAEVARRQAELSEEADRLSVAALDTDPAIDQEPGETEE